MDPAGTSKTAFLDVEPFSFSQALSFENESSKITDFCMFRCIIICVHIFIVQTFKGQTVLLSVCVNALFKWMDIVRGSAKILNL